MGLFLFRPPIITFCVIFSHFCLEKSNKEKKGYFLQICIRYAEQLTFLDVVVVH